MPLLFFFYFFFNDTATTEIYTLSLHDALPICFHTFWRVWLLAAVQDGSEGEPLRAAPWNLAARYSGRPQPYDAGGEYAGVLPPGYFVDFTTLADDYGWSRVPADTNWRQFYPGILYWRF